MAGPCKRSNERAGSVNAGNFLTTGEPVRFSRRIPFHGISICWDDTRYSGQSVWHILREVMKFLKLFQVQLSWSCVKVYFLAAATNCHQTYPEM